MNRFRSSRRFRAWLVVAVAALAAAAAGVVAVQARGADSTTIEVVTFYPEGAPDYENLVAIDKGFEKAHPGVNVNLVFGGGQNAPNIVARWRAGDPPEVNVGFFGPTKDEQAYARAGQVYDLTKAMNQPVDPAYGKNVKWKDAIYPSLRRFMTMNGHYYSAPREVTAITFYYNRKIFDKYDIKPPKTWQDFLDVCAALKKHGVAPLTVTGTFNGYMEMYYDYLLARRSGVKAAVEAIDGTKSFSSVPGAKAAANDLQTLVKRGYFLKGFQGTDFTSAQLDFFQGKAAMILMGTWLVGEMKDSIPKSFQLGTFSFPQIPGGKGPHVLFGGVNTMTVAAQSKHPELGVEWLKYFSRKSVQTQHARALDYLSAYKDVPAGPKYAGIVKSLSKGGSFAASYFGIFGHPKAVQDAYQQPIAKLFFGKISGNEMVSEIDSNLRSATSQSQG